MADNYTLPRKSGTSSLPNQVFALFDMLPRELKSTNHDRYYCDFRGPMNPSDFQCKFLVLLHLLLLSPGDVLVRWHRYVNTCPFLCIFMHKSNIWPIMLQHFVCVDSHVPSNPHFSIFCDWQGLMVRYLKGIRFAVPSLTD